MIAGKNQKRCSFCGKKEDQVALLISNEEGCYICDECVAQCEDIVEEKMVHRSENKNLCKGNLTPKEIKAALDEYVIGQEDAKKILAVAVFNHFLRIQNKSTRKGGVELQKSNILMLGPTGSGKTELARTLARIIDVPFAIVDATSLTEAGYVGEDVESILLKLLQAADYDIDRAQRGIIYIDEIDKLSKKTEGMSTSRDVSGEGVQQALLKIVEGTLVSIPPQRGKIVLQQNVQIDTTNILFICGGAFVGLEQIVRNRTEDKTMGFGMGGQVDQDKADDGMILPCDLARFGMIPELLGRFPVLVALEQLDRNTLIRILSEPRNAILREYQQLLHYQGVQLQFDKKALEAIADRALELGTGARGLRSIVENALMDVMYTIPSEENLKSCRITEEVINGSGKPELKYKRMKSA